MLAATLRVPYCRVFSALSFWLSDFVVVLFAAEKKNLSLIEKVNYRDAYHFQKEHLFQICVVSAARYNPVNNWSKNRIHLSHSYVKNSVEKVDLYHRTKPNYEFLFKKNPF